MRALLVPFLVLLAAPVASAQEIVSPRDGVVVDSRPLFTVAAGVMDPTGPDPGSLNVEISRTADLQTAGDKTGKFVDPVDSDIAFFRDDKTLDPNTIRWGPSRLLAGDYFWHALLETYDGRKWPWSPVLRFTVEDEPVILTGWTMRAQRLKAKGKCRTRVQLIGKATFEDNERTPTATASVRLVGTGKSFTVEGLYSGGSIRAIGCTKLRSLRVALSLEDDGGHTSATLKRTVSVR